MAPDNADLVVLEKRLGRRHARARLGIEQDHEAQIFGQGINFFHSETLTLSLHLGRRRLLGGGRALQLPAEITLHPLSVAR